MKLARLIFRYRSHLDDLFMSQPEPQVIEAKYVFDVSAKHKSKKNELSFEDNKWYDSILDKSYMASGF